MSRATQRSFTGGELSPSLHYRVDLNKYQNSLAQCFNAWIHAEGGVSNRTGTEFICEVKDSTEAHRVIPFKFNTEQAYALLFGVDGANPYMQVIKDGGLVLETTSFTVNAATQANPVAITTSSAHGWATNNIVFITGVGGMTELNNKFYRVTVTGASTLTLHKLDGGNIDGTAYTAFTAGGTIARVHEVATPFTNTNDILENIQHAQSADVMTLVEKNLDPRELTRTAHDAWTLSTISFAPTQAAPTGLALGTVGAGGGANNKTYEYVVTAVNDEGEESLPSTAANHNVTSLSDTFGSQLTWTAPAGNISHYNIYKTESFNAGVYGYIGTSVTLTFDDFNIAPDMTAGPPESRLPFAGADDKPGAVSYYQQRLMFASTDNRPQTVFGSEINNYNSLRRHDPIIDPDAVEFTLASREVNEVRHLIGLDSLILLTAGAEHLTTEGSEQVLSPLTVGTRPISYNGAAKVSPAVIDNNAIYVQEKGTRLRDLYYEGSTDGRGGYTGTDLTILARHLFKYQGTTFTVVDMAFQKEPFGILWVVRSDGKLLSFTYQREHQVFAWALHETDGLFESVCAVPEGTEDAVYFVVQREINGTPKRYVERLHTREMLAAENAFFVDCGLTYSGAATTTITNLGHLEGEDVIVLADGNVVRGLTVEDEQIELPVAAELVHIGLSYESLIETLDIDSVERTTRGIKKSVAEVTIAFEQSRGGFVGPTEDSNDLIEIKPREVEDGYDSLPLRDYERRVSIKPKWSDGGRVVYKQVDPLPFTILAITPSFDVAD